MPSSSHHIINLFINKTSLFPDSYIPNRVCLVASPPSQDNRPNQTTKPNQTKPNQTKPNQTKPNQTKPNQTKPNQISLFKY